MLVILRREEAAALERNPHDFQILRLDEVKERHLHRRLARGLRLAFQPEGQLGIALHGNSASRKGGSLDAGHGIEAVVNLAPSGANGIRGADRGGKRHVEGQHVVGIESRIDAPEFGEAANHQSGARQQDDGERHFHDHENPLGAMPGAARPAPSLLERFLKIALRILERRGQAEQDSCQHGSGEHEQQHAPVEMDFLGSGQCLGQHLERPLQPPRGKEQTQAPAGQSEQDAFGQKLPNDAAAGRAQRGADGEFTGASRRARQQEIRHVHAGDEKNKTHRGQQHQQNRLDVAHHVLFERNQA